VGTITVSPGRIAAQVHDGDRDTTHRAVVFVHQLTEDEWQRFGAQVAARAGHLAALLDRDLPYDLVEASEDAGVRLLPDPGDLQPECGCPGFAHPCRHAAALCYQTSWLLDSDPLLLLLIRGRGERELVDLVDEMARHTTRGHIGGVGGPRTSDTTDPHRMAEVDPAPEVDPAALRRLAAEAAARARELLSAAGCAQPPGGLEH
jgi:uncharacterized Zn finger protein